MHGVSRFLSRRDKQHEKRASTGSGHKVRPVSLSSIYPFTTVPSSSVPVSLLRRRKSSSFELLYDKLPSTLRSTSLLFLQHKTPCRAFLTPVLVSINTLNSSDPVPPQSRSSQVSSDLYSIFTSQGSKTAADKELENKVRGHSTCHVLVLMGPGQDTPLTTTRRRNIATGGGAGAACFVMVPRGPRRGL